MTDFVEDLEVQGVELWVEEDRLRYRGDQDRLTPEVLARLKEHKAGVIALQRQRAERFRLCPLSHGQSALWFLHQLAPASAAYHVGFAAQIHSRVDIPALQRAFQNLASRHASLRTTFRKRNGSPVQEIHAHLPPAFEAVHVGPLGEPELKLKVIEAHNRPFDLEAGPLLRASLFTCAAEHHVFLLTVHHLVCDAWSLWLLLEELGASYRAESNAAKAALPPLTTGYSDFVRWQRQLLAGEEGERLWAYWKSQLDGELPVLNLPTDRPRPSVQTFKGGSVRFQLSPRLTAGIKAFASAEGTTLYMTLLAAFAALLHRHAGQDEILLGSPTSGRTQREFADIIGDFINTVVMRSSSAGDPGFRAYLARFNQTALEAIAHESFPFSLLVERLRANRDPGRSPIFQILFNFLKPQKFQDVIELWVAGETGDRVEWGGLSLGPFSLPQQEGQVDLALEMVEGKSSLFGIFKYNVDLFDEATIRRMAGHFETLLEGIVADPDQPLSRLPLLKETERHQLLVDWNRTQADFPRDQCVHQLFEAQVARTPQSVAAVFEGQSLTYSQLNAQADELAARLRLLGVGPDILVGLCVRRSLEMLVGLLGILKAGGAYLPLDPDHPQARLDFVLQDAGIALLVTQKTVLSSLPFKGQPADRQSLAAADSPRAADLLILQLAVAEAGQTASLPPRPIASLGPEDLAYVIYTSGSTGQPKGVQLCHRGVVNFLTSMSKEPGLSAHDTIVALTTLSFDIAVLELFLPLTVGGRVIIASREVAIDPERLAGLIRQSAATVVQATPATWRLLVESGWPGDPGLKIFVGGEPLPAPLVDQLLTRCASLWNMYGPTETTVWSATSRIVSADRISIGRPIANTELYVLHAGNQLAPIGVPGELYIGGEGLARGYWNRPDLTGQAFVPHPFNHQNQARLYKTGDLVRFTPQRELEFLGRVDHQVKIRGYRVELGEIETALRLHPAVKDAIVLAREDVPGDKRLVAYVVSPASSAPSAAELRRQLAEKLPEYMVPSAFITLDTFPLNPSGKIDRKALPKPRQELSPAPTLLNADHTRTQQTLAGIWSELLDLEKPGLDDNLFHLGGHSLVALRLVSQIQQQLSVKLPVATVFLHPTIRELSAIVDAPTVGVADTDSRPQVAAREVAKTSDDSDLPGGKPGFLSRLGLESENLLRGGCNRILQLAARAAPAALRVVLHRWRGVRIGSNVLIGYDSIIETSYPWLVAIGNGSAIGMRVTIIGHFLGGEKQTLEHCSASVEIGERVWIGPGALILPNVKIGDGAVVAAGSVVSSSVPAATMVQGNPAKVVAKCPVPISRGMLFEDFLKLLEPV